MAYAAEASIEVNCPDSNVVRPGELQVRVDEDMLLVSLLPQGRHRHDAHAQVTPAVAREVGMRMIGLAALAEGSA